MMIYRNIKKVIKRLASTVPPAYRQKRQYWQVLSFLKDAEWWDKERIDKWQLKRLRHVVEHAYYNIPGFRTLYKEAGVTPLDLRSLRDIKYLPFLTKDLLRDNLKDFASPSLSQTKRVYVTTGGSTAIPFGFYLTKGDLIREWSFMHSGWARAGWQLGESSAILRGAFVGTRDKFWHYDPYRRELMLSSYYLTERTYKRYVEEIGRFKPHHLQAYPSAALILSDLVIDNGDIGKLSFQIIFLGSENVYPWQSAKIARAFPGAKIFSWYGQAEHVILAPMCEHSEVYHLWPFYGITEVINEKGEEAFEGDNGELVGTSLWNFSTPFIRYRTMDTARKGKFGCGECGRQFQLLQAISGRLQEMIITKNHRHISMTAINMHDDIFDSIKQFQFYQDTMGEVVFKYIPKKDLSSKELDTIRAGLMLKLGDDVKLTFSEVKEIVKSKTGKYRFLDQRLMLKYGDK
jgi:phenylacetate-CoA ligase